MADASASPKQVDSDNSFATKKAAEWLRLALTGDANALFNLGECYYHGMCGVDENYLQAETLYRQAAEKGHVEGMANLGYFYRYGHGGRRDYALARVWLTEAADMGSHLAMFHLSEMYAKGQGGPIDLVEARRLNNIARDQKSQFVSKAIPSE